MPRFAGVFCYPVDMQEVSVVIIAHNEEEHIGRCLRSILSQSLKPTEILLIAHNCTDQTPNIARQFPEVKVLEYAGPEGIGYARAYGIAQAKGEVIACRDGDSYALTSKWLENLTAPILGHPDIVATGGPVWFVGSWYAWLMGLNFFFLKPLWDTSYVFYFWGANFAFRKRAYDQTSGLAPLLSNRNIWNLTYWADDYFLYKQLRPLGKVVFVKSAPVASQADRISLIEWNKRSKEQGRDKAKIDAALA